MTCSIFQEDKEFASAELKREGEKNFWEIDKNN